MKRTVVLLMILASAAIATSAQGQAQVYFYSCDDIGVSLPESTLDYGKVKAALSDGTMVDLARFDLERDYDNYMTFGPWSKDLPKESRSIVTIKTEVATFDVTSETLTCGQAQVYSVFLPIVIK